MLRCHSVQAITEIVNKDNTSTDGTPRNEFCRFDLSTGRGAMARERQETSIVQFQRRHHIPEERRERSTVRCETNRSADVVVQPQVRA